MDATDSRLNEAWASLGYIRELFPDRAGLQVFLLSTSY